MFGSACSVALSKPCPYMCNTPMSIADDNSPRHGSVMQAAPVVPQYSMEPVRPPSVVVNTYLHRGGKRAEGCKGGKRGRGKGNREALGGGTGEVQGV